MTIDEGTSKTRSRRTVSIPENCIQWLLPHAVSRPSLRITRKPFQKIRDRAGLSLWQPDICRHTGISYHLAKDNDDKETAIWAGNSQDIIHKHYKALIQNKNDITEFYAITPDDNEEKILQFPMAAKA